MRVKQCVITLAGLYCLGIAQGNTLSDASTTQELLRQQDQQRLRAEQKTLEAKEPDTRTGATTSGGWDLPTAERGCEVVNEVHFAQELPRQLSWLEHEVASLRGLCLGPQGLQAATAFLNQQIASAGFVTTKMAAESPAPLGGKITFILTLGLIADFVLDEGDGSRKTWPVTLRLAIPGSRGELLNIRDLDQGSEQIQRLGDELKIFIVPAESPSNDTVMHDIVAQWTPSAKPWRLALSLDDSGIARMGRTRGSLQFSWSNPLRLSDQLLASASSNLESPRVDKKTSSQYLNYSVGLGYHRFQLSRSLGHSGQQVKGNTIDFLSTRFDAESQIEWRYTVFRDAQYKVELDWAYSKQKGRNYLEDVELVVQRRDAATRRQGVRVSWLSNQSDIDFRYWRSRVSPVLGEEDRLFRLDVASQSHHVSLDFNTQFSVLARGWRYNAQFEMLRTGVVSALADVMSLGGRYTIRGFTGDQPISAHDGALLRQEVSTYYAQRWAADTVVTTQPYLFIDVGRLWGETAPSTRSASAIGAGLRISGNKFSLDFSLGHALAGRGAQGSPVLVPNLSISFNI